MVCDLALRIAKRLEEKWTIGKFNSLPDYDFSDAGTEDIATVIREVVAEKAAQST